MSQAGVNNMLYYYYYYYYYYNIPIRVILSHKCCRGKLCSQGDESVTDIDVFVYE